MDIDMTSFTEKEKHWYNVKLECDKVLEYERSLEKPDWHDVYTTDGLSKYLNLSLKYGNLKDPMKEISVRKNLIKINKVIPTVLLDFDGYDYIMFNGIYIAHDVTIVSKEICDKMFKRRDPVFYCSELGIPEDTMMGTIKWVQFEDTGGDYGICLKHSPFTERYGICTFNSWDYVYF